MSANRRSFGPLTGVPSTSSLVDVSGQIQGNLESSGTALPVHAVLQFNSTRLDGADGLTAATRGVSVRASESPDAASVARQVDENKAALPSAAHKERFTNIAPTFPMMQGAPLPGAERTSHARVACQLGVDGPPFAGPPVRSP